jgi:hypothetical protein
MCTVWHTLQRPALLRDAAAAEAWGATSRWQVHVYILLIVKTTTKCCLLLLERVVAGSAGVRCWRCALLAQRNRSATGRY